MPLPGPPHGAAHEGGLAPGVAEESAWSGQVSGVGSPERSAACAACAGCGARGRAPRAPAGGRRCVGTAVSSEALTGTFCSVLTGVLPAGGCLSVPQEITKVILTPDSPCGLSPPAGSSKPHRHGGKVRGWDLVPQRRHPPGASGPALWRPRRCSDTRLGPSRP